MKRVRQYGYHIAVALDQLLNAILCGAADETLSSRAYRMAMIELKSSKYWRVIHKTIDSIFFWEKSHCKTAYESELDRKQYSDEFRSKLKNARE